MIECRICHCLCDPGDTINGVCDDCRMEKETEDEKEQAILKMLQTDGQQMRIENFI